MQSLGLFFIFLGVVGGCLVAVLDKATIEWAWFVPLLFLGAIGVALVQIALRRQATDTTLTEANFQAIKSSLGDIVEKLGTLDRSKTEIDVYDLPERIDHDFRDDIVTFVDARMSIAHVHGMQAYADVMSHFAAAERYLNRVWSCAADGYIDEAHEYLGRSHAQFSEARQRLKALQVTA